MQNQRTDDGKDLQLIIITPDGSAKTVACDSVHVTVCDSKKTPGGSYGIRKGHAASVVSLGEGGITAFLDGKTVFSALLPGGFAKISPDRVTVVTESVMRDEKQ